MHGGHFDQRMIYRVTRQNHQRSLVAIGQTKIDQPLRHGSYTIAKFGIADFIPGAAMTFGYEYLTRPFVGPLLQPVTHTAIIGLQLGFRAYEKGTAFTCFNGHTGIRQL